MMMSEKKKVAVKIQGISLFACLFYFGYTVSSLWGTGFSSCSVKSG